MWLSLVVGVASCLAGIAASDPAPADPVAAAPARASAPPPAPQSPPPRAIDRSARLRAAVGVAGGLDLGTLPRVAPTVLGNLTLLLRRARVGTIASFGTVPHHDLPGTDGAASVSWWSVGVEAGPLFRVRTFEFPLMFGAEAGQMIVRPIDLFDAQRRRIPWGAALVQPGVAYVPLPWLAVVARLGLAVPFAHPRFLVEGVGEFHRPAAVALRASLGIELRFPGGR